VARRQPGRPRRSATNRATPARPGHPSLATATRQATRRHRHPDRLASTTRHRSPQRHHGPIPTGTRGKAQQPHPGRLSRHPPRAIGGRRRTPTRRPPRRSTLVAHPQPTTANAEPGPRKPRGSHSDETYDHDLTRAAGTEAALGAASGVRPEPLKPRQIATRRSVSVGCVAEPPANHSQSPARPPRV
jgi:hypothetical protein